VQDVRVAVGHIEPGRVLQPLTSDQPDEAAAPVGPFLHARWTDQAEPGLTLDASELIAHHVEDVVCKSAASFIGVQETHELLHRAQKHYPQLAAEVARLVPTPRLTEVLQRLLQEHIPIRDLKTIFESLVANSPNEPDIIMLTEAVRCDLRRYISRRYASAADTLEAVILVPALEDAVLHAIEATPHGSICRLDDAALAHLRSEVKQCLLRPAGAPPVVLVPMDIRRHVAKLLDVLTPPPTVLSYQELTPNISVHTLAVVGEPVQA
jgi:type III secretion protein V